MGVPKKSGVCRRWSSAIHDRYRIEREAGGRMRDWRQTPSASAKRRHRQCRWVLGHCTIIVSACIHDAPHPCCIGTLPRLPGECKEFGVRYSEFEGENSRNPFKHRTSDSEPSTPLTSKDAQLVDEVLRRRWDTHPGSTGSPTPRSRRGHRIVAIGVPVDCRT